MGITDDSLRHAAPLMLELKNVAKRFGREAPWILKDISLSLGEGSVAVIQGRSGSGKTTLLNIIAGLEPSSKGNVFFRGRALHLLTDAEKAQYRNLHIGCCFQESHVQKQLTVLENLILPLLVRGAALKDARDKGGILLGRLGLSCLLDKSPGILSGGQLQRLSLGRALIGGPDLVLADEPTANLDEVTAKEILHLILHYQKENNAALVLVTHDPVPQEPRLKKYLLSDGLLHPSP